MRRNLLERVGLAFWLSFSDLSDFDYVVLLNGNREEVLGSKRSAEKR